MADAVADKAHAKRSPSGAKKRKLCPGSVVLEAGREDRPSRYAAEGTVAHAVMELCLEPGTRGEPVLDAEGFIGRIMEADGFEFEVDHEMADKVNEFVAHVLMHIDPAAGDVLLVEQSVPIGHITGEADGRGTADVVGITEGGTRLVVLDLKYGRGVRVMAGDMAGGAHAWDENNDLILTPNPQLAYYGLGALEEQGVLYDLHNVTLGIGQPRLDHFDTIDLTIGELEAFGKELAKAEMICDGAEGIAAEGHSLDAYLNPGEDQCKFCKAKAICPALREEVDEFAAGAAAASSDFADLTEAVKAETQVFGMATAEEQGQNIGALMAKIPLIESWITAIRAEAEAELFAGRPVAGYKLVQGKQGNRAWKDTVEATAVLKGARLKVDEMFDHKLKSPTQIEKVLKDRPKLWAKVQPHITRSEGQPSVAPESDKRPALDLTAGADDFGDLGGDDGAEFV